MQGDTERRRLAHSFRAKLEDDDANRCCFQKRITTNSLSPDGPAAAVEAVEEHGEAASAERQQTAAGSDAAEEQVADAEEHRVDQREAQHPVEEVVAEGGVI